MAKVLIVEDDKFLANAYRVKLVKAGFTIQIAGDGEEAMSMVKTFIPDIIILDLILPIKDGFTVLQELRADTSTAHIPVLVATNLGQEEDKQKSLQLGATDVIVKSDTTLDQVVETMNAILKKH